MRTLSLAAGIALIIAGAATQWTARDTGAATVSVQAASNPNLFDPQDITIAVGDTVRWTAIGNAPHDVASDTGAWTASPTLQNGDTFDVTFTNAGEYIYICTFHALTGQYPGGMTGKVIVQAAAQPTATSTTASGAPTATRTPGRSATPTRTPTGTVTVLPSATPGTPVPTLTPLPASAEPGAPTSVATPAGAAAAGISGPQTGSGSAPGGGASQSVAIALGLCGALAIAAALLTRRRKA